MQRVGLALPLGQHAHQRAAGEFAAQPGFGLEHQPAAEQRPAQRERRVVAVPVAVDLHRAGFAAAHERPLFEATAVGVEGQAVVARQFVRVRGGAGARQVIRRGADDARGGAQRAGNERRVGQGAEAQGEVDLVAQQILQAVADREVQAYAGVRAQEVVEPGQQHAVREPLRRREADDAGQPAAGVVGLRHTLVEQVERAFGVGEQRLPGFGQAHGPRRALEEAQRELRLQALERRAGRRGREAEAPGGGRERAAARRFDEDAQVLDVFNVHLKIISVLAD